MIETLEGLVIARAPGYFIVRSDDGLVRLCKLRGRLLHARIAAANTHKSPSRRPAVSAATSTHVSPVTVAVGDRVHLTPDGSGGGAIEGVLPRRNKLSRTASESREEQILLANLDLVLLVFAVQDPSPHFGLLDRYLVLAEDAGIPVALCMNKLDLGVPEEVGEMMALYESLGYTIHRTSLVWNMGLTLLQEQLAKNTALLTGPSGVGKSSLLNAIEPEAAQRIGEISATTHKGRHTTTGVRLFPLHGGGWLADSAGIRELALWGVERERLAPAFVEFRPYLGQCAYDDCLHEDDAQGCAIIMALDEGKIHPRRYASYLRLLNELG